MQRNRAWRVLSFRDVAKFVNGFAFKPSDWKRKGLPIIRIQNLNDPDKEFNYFDGECDNRFLVKDGDILISWSASLGVYTWNGCDAVLNQHIFKVIPDEEIVDREFFYYFAKTKIDEMATKVHGSTMKHITKEPFLSTEIEVPPIDTQKKIAAIMKKADLVNKSREQTNKIADKLVQSIFLHLFGDPATNPMKWNVVPFGSLIKESRNGFGRRNKSGKQEGYVVLRIQDIQKGEIDTEDLNRIPMTEFEFEKYQLLQNDILFVRVNGNIELVGKVALFDINSKEMAFNDHIVRLRVIDGVEPIFLKCFLESNYARKEIKKLAVTSAGQFSVGQLRLSALPVPLPPLNLQRKFSLITQIAKSLKKNQDSSTQKINQLFNSLMSKAFNGVLVN